MIDKTRELALKILYEIEKNEAYSNIALDKILQQARKQKETISTKDVGFISELVYGTISWKLTLDEIIKKYSSIKIKKISIWILNILRMSIYQIVFLDKVPKSAAVNEGVNLAKRYGHKASSNFVNAILRKVDKKDYKEFFEIKEIPERISKTTSMPSWLVEELLKEKTLEEVKTICENSNIRPKLWIRTNTLKTDTQTLQEELKKEKIDSEKGTLEEFLMLKGAKNIEKIQAYQEGKFTVQDEAAGLVAKVLNPKPGESVLDACSSPGGKTTYLAQIMQNKGEIIAWDIYSHRINLVDRLAKRLGISIIKTQVKDATLWEEKYSNHFDKILLDVPCLGIGVLKRKPDIKWKRKKEDIVEITNLQKNILENCSKYLKKGGKLVYATCSILKEENEKIVENFLQKHQDFELETIEEIKGNFFEKFLEKNSFLQVYQNEKTDGFFICKMRKK